MFRLIIWREIIEFARENPIKGVVLLTNDNKPDWVFVPPAVMDENGKVKNNEAHKGFKIILPLPLLCHELRSARRDAELTIANLGMIAQILHPELGVDAANLFSAYQLAAATVLEPETVEDSDAVDEVAQSELPKTAPAEPATDLAAILTSLASRDADAASAAAVSIRPLLSDGSFAPKIPLIAQGLVTAAEHAIEASTILIRDILTDRLELGETARTRLT